MNIGLEVNLEKVELGTTLDQEFMREAGFKKAGILAKKALSKKILPNDVVYFAKNPLITIFNEAVTATPITGVSARALGITNGTSSYFIYNQQKLRYVICQVIHNAEVATKFISDIKNAALEELGEPIRSSYTIEWFLNNEHFILELAFQHGYMHWKLDPAI